MTALLLLLVLILIVLLMLRSGVRQADKLRQRAQLRAAFWHSPWEDQ